MNAPALGELTMGVIRFPTFAIGLWGARTLQSRATRRNSRRSCHRFLVTTRTTRCEGGFPRQTPTAYCYSGRPDNHPSGQSRRPNVPFVGRCAQCPAAAVQPRSRRRRLPDSGSELSGPKSLTDRPMSVDAKNLLGPLKFPWTSDRRR